jgi:hypothetical protein
MIKKLAFVSLFASAIALLCAAVNAQGFPILDRIADKVIQKYQRSTCEQLWEQRAQKGKAPGTADGTGSSPDVEIRSTDALGFYQQGSRSDRQ